MNYIQQDSLVKEQLLKDANQDVLQKMAQFASLSKIIEGMKFINHDIPFYYSIIIYPNLDWLHY